MRFRGVFPIDLMELSFQEFDMILGKDWLVEDRVVLDCECKRVTFKVRDNVEVAMVRSVKITSVM